jgi:uncharacterized protein (DUF2267 family)
MYDPPEPSQEELDEFETQQAVKRAPTVAITGLTAESVQIIIEQAIQNNYSLRKKADAAVTEAVETVVREAIESKMDALMDEQLRPEVARILAEGWSKTNSYGEPVGQRLTLRDRIATYLNGDGYRKPLDEIFRSELERQLKTEAGKAFTEALNGLRGRVDSEFGARIQAAIKTAFGMKP